MTRLLVVRLGSLGDLVHTLPAVASIRRARPEVEIDWLVDAAHEEFLALVPVLTTVVALRAPTAGGWANVVGRLRGRHYDVALDFQGLVKSATLARLSGARRVIGFDRGALRERAAAVFYHERVSADDGAHVIRKNLRLAAHAGGAEGALEFPIAAVASGALETIRRATDAPLALLNPGAAWPNKRWPVDRFGRVAAWLARDHGLQSVVVWGPGEQRLADHVVQASSGAAIAAPPTRLVDLVALARAARLMVSGDTGPTHIAAAVGTPIVALFGPTSPARNGPWSDADLSVSKYGACDCHYERRCRRDAAAWCLAGISEDEVRRAIERRLGAGSGESRVSRRSV